MLPTALAALWKERRAYGVIVVCDFRLLGLLGVLAARVFGKQCVLRAESCGEMDGSYATKYSKAPSPLKQKWIKAAVWLRNAMLMRADAFLSISSVIREEFRAAGVAPGMIVEIPNGIDLNRFKPASLEERSATTNAGN